MKKILNTALLIILFISVLSCRAEAVVLDKKMLEEKIKTSVENQIKQNFDIDGRIEIKSVKLPYGDIEVDVSDVKSIKTQTSINLKYFNTTTIAKVNLIINGKSVSSFVSQIKISTYDKVWVAKDYIRRGEVLSNVAFEEREVSFASKGIKDRKFDIYKYIAKKNYRPGDTIDMTFIKPAPDIVKDGLVFVMFKSSNVSVTVPGKAMEEGNIGDYIRVRSKEFRKDYRGKIISECQILVNI